MSAFGRITRRRHHPTCQLDRDGKGEVYSPKLAILEVSVVTLPEGCEPCGPVGWPVHAYNRLDPPYDGHRIAAKGVDLYSLFKQGDLRTAIVRPELGEPFIDCVGPTLEVTNARPIGNSRQHRVDKIVDACARRPSRDQLESHSDGTVDFRNRLIEVKFLFRFQSLSNFDDRLPLQAA